LSFTEGKNDFLRQVVSLKNRFPGLAQVALSVCKRHKMSIQGIRNDIAGSGEHRNHRFPDIALFAFLAVYKAKNG
jgi:hypothetical protein